MSRLFARHIVGQLRSPAKAPICLPRWRPIQQGSRAFNTTPHIVEPVPRVPSEDGGAPSRLSASMPGGPNHTSPLLPFLSSQPSHYVTIHIHGQPYLVTQGDTIRLPFKMPGVLPGDILRLNRASVLGSRDFTLKGSPYIEEGMFECRAVVLGTESEPMRIKIKKKQRCRRKKTAKSKHRYTVLRIQHLSVGQAN